jgi:Trk K+ transport system NAD-binding subunit
MIGMLTSGLLILEMGILSILFTVAITILSIGWYYYYAYAKIDRQGAIYHVTERLGQYKDHGLESEMRHILQEKGLRDEDPYELVVSKATVCDVTDEEMSYQDVVDTACANLAEKAGISEKTLHEAFDTVDNFGAIPIGNGAALNHTRLDIDIDPELVIVRIKHGLKIESEYYNSLVNEHTDYGENLHAIFFLVSPEDRATQHLRFLAHTADMIDQDDFLEKWIDADDEGQLREILLRNERFITITIRSENKTRDMIGKKIKEIDLPAESLVTILKREGQIKIPHGDTVVQEGDRLSIIGEPEDINKVKELTKTSSE